MAELLDERGRPVTSTQIARIRADANRPGEGRFAANAYEGGDVHGQWFNRWRTAIRSPDLEWFPNRDQAVGRARDLARNDTVAGAAIARTKNRAVGRGWRLSSKPNARALGITQEQASELSAQIESEWALYAYGHNFSIDAERRLTFGQLLRVAVHGFMADGEGCGAVEWAADEGTRYATRLHVIDPDRLSNPTGRINDAFWRNGIEHNARGVPVRYWFRQAHPADYVWTGEAFQWIGVERFTPWGRPQVLHWFDPERAAQSRGVTRFVQALRMFRALAKFTDYTLQNAAMNALKVGFVYSSSGPEAVSDALNVDDLKDINSARRDYYGKHPVGDADEANYAVLPFGDKVEMATAERGVTGFDAFVRSIIRLIASSLGVTYEEISMDYSQTNYSSARAALIHAQAETEALNGLLEAQLVKPFFVAWLEEAFDRGYITPPAGAPDFYDAADAYAEARWIGPKRGYIDPVKEILAAAARIEAGVSTLEKECADQGDDWVEIKYQLAEEQALDRKLGLSSPDASAAQAIKDTTAKGFAKGEDGPQPAPEDTPPPTGAVDDSQPKAAPPWLAPKSALARLAAIAASPEHEAALDARPTVDA